MSLLTIANALSWGLQVAVIVSTALLMLRVVHVDAPAVRYLLLRVVLLVCVLLPLAQPRWTTEVTGGVVQPNASQPVVTHVGATALVSSAIPVDASSTRWTSALGFVLVAGVMLRLLWVGLGVIRLRRLRRVGHVVPIGPEYDELSSMIETAATVRYVRALGQPVTFGFRSPVVLLPDSLIDHPTAIRRAVLAHELWHVRRRDWLWTVFEESLRAMFWFHPAIWILVSKIQTTREEVVDELTILVTGSRRTYVNALLAYADRPPLIAATAFARRRHLLHRVMLISKESAMSARRVVAGSAVAVAVVLSAGWLSVQAFPLTQTERAAEQPTAGPGPVERRAKPITPENPVPRRTLFVPADYPVDAETMNVRGIVTVRLALDESGHVAETRLVGFSLNLGDKGTISVSEPAGINVETAMKSQGRLSPGTDPQSLRPVVENATAAALRAVKQWQYAPPADGPIAFNVSLPFGPASAGAIPPPPPPAPPAGGAGSAWLGSEGAVRVGGNIKPPVKLYNVNPIYPPDALAARAQGVVIIEARIEADGSIVHARVLRSIPLLDDAAIEAVRQWRFTPTVLNGAAVPVLMTVTVNFTMD